MTIKLSELEALEKAATKGDWFYYYSDAGPTLQHANGWIALFGKDYCAGKLPQIENAKLIAAARNALPELLAFVRKARKLLTDYTFPCAAEYLGEYLKVLDGEAKKLLETIED